MSATVPTPPVPLWAAIRARLSEASTWAGIGGILLAGLNLLPAALPEFHTALGQHGWAKMTGMTVALASFAIAIAKKEGNATIVEIAQAADAIITAEKAQKCAVLCPDPMEPV